MTQYMKFSHGIFSLDVSESFDDKTMIVQMYGSGNSCKIELSEQGVRELRKWFTIQIRKMNKAKPKTVKTK